MQCCHSLCGHPELSRTALATIAPSITPCPASLAVKSPTSRRGANTFILYVVVFNYVRVFTSLLYIIAHLPWHPSIPFILICTHSTYFRYFKAELDRGCPFWSNDNAQCNLESCAICECNEADIPDALRTHIEFGWINENNRATTSSAIGTIGTSTDHQSISTEQSVIDASTHSSGTSVDRIKLRCGAISVRIFWNFPEYSLLVYLLWDAYKNSFLHSLIRSINNSYM
jgi:hypothetical protein